MIKSDCFFLLLIIFGTLVHSFKKTKHRKNMICTRKDHNGKINYLNERKEEKKNTADCITGCYCKCCC